MRVGRIILSCWARGAVAIDDEKDTKDGEEYCGELSWFDLGVVVEIARKDKRPDSICIPDCGNIRYSTIRFKGAQGVAIERETDEEYDTAMYQSRAGTVTPHVR